MSTVHDLPDLRRLRYFQGQFLGPRDLQREQEYFRAKSRLHLRYLLGYGVVCGLGVECGPPQDHHEDSEKTRRAYVTITPGLGVDACGREIVAGGPCTVDLFGALSAEERTDPDCTLWVGVEYAEEAVEPTRTVFTSDCAGSDCENGWIREGYRVRVTATKPEPDRRCTTCDAPPDDDVLWLARIEHADPHRPVRAEDVHVEIRRPFGLHVPTVITGISWDHGGTYTVQEAKDLLGTVDEDGGLRVRFSDDIRTDSLRRGVLDVQVIEGGAGKNADSWFMGGAFADCGDDEFTRELRFRQTTRETLQDDDRVLITIRTAFLLDRCCRPVDGTHVGGKVPRIDCEPEPPGPGCATPPRGYGPWTSGIGRGGDVFESWFFVREG
ncbi:hypothetical protein J2S43_001696 [Catenuloplanes nepalensis]|uniref:Uncharacterized protein n=1 Tax=Catenuloplanes nepalensis TaxID=587533 RepID=A0ABT9MP24_9ACTN|nr:hypothetical protein [Catenuloplanes nepalensis]MDP9793184.1 hypothetical protein [Catenuloplanes nepalensis]